MLWRDLDWAPHPGQKVGCRLSTVTVQACSRRSTLTTVKPAPGDHVIDVFIAPCCRIPSQGASQPTSARASHPASPAPRVNQTRPRWLPTAAADLAERDAIGVFPVGGWWKEKPYLERFESKARYTLIVRIKAPGSDVDIYTAVETQIALVVEVQ